MQAYEVQRRSGPGWKDTVETADLVTARKVAQMTGIPEATVRKMAKQCRIPVVRIGGCLRFSENVIREWPWAASFRT
jgi:excisionase family DNA binding protein